MNPPFPLDAALHTRRDPGCCAGHRPWWRHAQASAEEQAVASVVENCGSPWGLPDQATLTSLTSPLLSYGHSGGKVDTQASFIGALMDKSSDFVSISLSDQTISISGNVAVVRHTWPAPPMTVAPRQRHHQGADHLAKDGQWACWPARPCARLTRPPPCTHRTEPTPCTLNPHPPGWQIGTRAGTSLHARYSVHRLAR